MGIERLRWPLRLLVVFQLSAGGFGLSANSAEVPSEFSGEATSTYGRRYGQPARRPHIIVILADDLGWNDVSFHGANQIPTPNIDALAYNGVILNSHYVSALCTPSRSALMTGKYPIHTGMQHFVLLEAEPRGLPLTEKLLPEYLREAGYRTHAIGKWHLGYHKREYTPTYRGFDSHFGYWNGLQDYYDHRVYSLTEKFGGFDMRRNMTAAWDTAGKYSTDLFTEEALRIIEEHDARTPIFLYLSHLAVHSGNENDPYQAPDDEIAKFSHIEDPERRTYAAMVSKLDASVGEVVAALGRRGMLDDSVILFMADNGAPTIGLHNNRGSNYPLRGMKDSAWEGGVRGVAALWSPLIEKPRRVADRLLSVVDWLPTLCSAAGKNPKDLGDIDGVDAWRYLISDGPAPRSEVLINIDDVDDYAAIRRGDFKYVVGRTDVYDGWYGESGRSDRDDSAVGESYAKSVLSSKAGVAIAGSTRSGRASESRRRAEGRSSEPRRNDRALRTLNADDVRRLRSQAEVRCDAARRWKPTSCRPVESPCLFNIKEDPCEYVNLAKKRPIVLATLEEALLKYRVTAIPAANVPNDPSANPDLWGGLWVNWRESDPPSTSTDNEEPSPETSRPAGSTITVVAVILGSFVVAVLILLAIKQRAKKTRLQRHRDNSRPRHQRRRRRRRHHQQHPRRRTDHEALPNDDREDGPVLPLGELSKDEQRRPKIGTEIQNLTKLDSIKDLARSIE